MGTWGSGIFDSDEANDLLNKFTDPWWRAVARELDKRELDAEQINAYAVPRLCVLTAITRENWPKLEDAVRWRKRALPVLQEYLAAAVARGDADANYARRRLAVVKKTFDKFIAAVRAHHAPRRHRRR